MAVVWQLGENPNGFTMSSPEHIDTISLEISQAWGPVNNPEFAGEATTITKIRLTKDN
jgi:hypothetical protein